MTLFLKQSAIFLVYLLLQVFVFNHFTLFDLATPHVFVIFILMLPLNIRYPVLILIAFFTGLFLDLFSVNVFRGLHAFTAVFVMSIREFWINIITNRATYRGSEEYLIQVQPTPWYLQYLLPLIFIYEVVYNILEAFSFSNFGNTFLKIGLSTLFTFVIVFIFTILFHRGSKR